MIYDEEGPSEPSDRDSIARRRFAEAMNQPASHRNLLRPQTGFQPSIPFRNTEDDEQSPEEDTESSAVWEKATDELDAKDEEESEKTAEGAADDLKSELKKDASGEDDEPTAETEFAPENTGDSEATDSDEETAAN
jgi:hypothetical protein